MHENRSEGCTSEAMDKAAENNHLSTLEWLRLNRSEGWTLNAARSAARGGHLNVLAYLLLGSKRETVARFCDGWGGLGGPVLDTTGGDGCRCRRCSCSLSSDVCLDSFTRCRPSCRCCVVKRPCSRRFSARPRYPDRGPVRRTIAVMPSADADTAESSPLACGLELADGGGIAPASTVTLDLDEAAAAGKLDVLEWAWRATSENPPYSPWDGTCIDYGACECFRDWSRSGCRTVFRDDCAASPSLSSSEIFSRSRAGRTGAYLRPLSTAFLSSLTRLALDTSAQATRAPAARAVAEAREAGRETAVEEGTGREPAGAAITVAVTPVARTTARHMALPSADGSIAVVTTTAKAAAKNCGVGDSVAASSQTAPFDGSFLLPASASRERSRLGHRTTTEAPPLRLPGRSGTLPTAASDDRHDQKHDRRASTFADDDRDVSSVARENRRLDSGVTADGANDLARNSEYAVNRDSIAVRTCCACIARDTLDASIGPNVDRNGWRRSPCWTKEMGRQALRARGRILRDNEGAGKNRFQVSASTAAVDGAAGNGHLEVNERSTTKEWMPTENSSKQKSSEDSTTESNSYKWRTR